MFPTHCASLHYLDAWFIIIIAVRCSDLANPSNGQVNQQGNKPGDRASYTCNSGYELVGLSSRICRNNGQWSGDAPTCESKYPHSNIAIIVGHSYIQVQ